MLVSRQSLSIQRLAPNGRIPLHSHDEPYAALILDGSYREFGDCGRREATCGHLVVHRPFTIHGDIAGPAGAAIVNLKLTVADSFQIKSGSVANPDRLLDALAEPGCDVAAELVGEIVPAQPPADAADLLARDLDRADPVRIEQWASSRGMSPRSLRRQFRSAIGMSPAHYRMRARSRAAWKAIVETDQPLAMIAADWSFADQAHLTRSIVALTGKPPNAWRASEALSVSFKTEARPSGSIARCEALHS